MFTFHKKKAHYDMLEDINTRNNYIKKKIRITQKHTHHSQAHIVQNTCIKRELTNFQ